MDPLQFDGAFGDSEMVKRERKKFFYFPNWYIMSWSTLWSAIEFDEVHPEYRINNKL